MSKAYNNALMAIENNAIGDGVIREVARLGGNQIVKSVPGLRVGEVSQRRGWTTGPRSKTRAIAYMVALLRDREIVLNDRLTVQQLSVITHAKDKLQNEMYATAEGKHDDLIMALAIGCDVLMSLEPARIHYREEEEEVTDVDRGLVIFAKPQPPAYSTWQIGTEQNRWRRHAYL